MLKLYCWVDETGQDTKGKFFLVSILLSDREQIEELKNRIGEIERNIKGKTKWTKTDNKRKILFLDAILKLTNRTLRIFLLKSKKTKTSLSWRSRPDCSGCP